VNFAEQIILNVLDPTNASLKLSFDVQPNIFNDIDVWTLGWPAHCCNAVSMDEFLS
jgi:hypothetical protein